MIEDFFLPCKNFTPADIADEGRAPEAPDPGRIDTGKAAGDFSVGAKKNYLAAAAHQQLAVRKSA